MSMPLSPTRLFVCDGCQATLPLDEDRAGQKCRCGRCGKILVVPGMAAKQEPNPLEYVSFHCRLCDTRLTSYVADVGQKLKCPDCGTHTVVPSPPKQRRTKQVPEAMHGQQYSLWGVDEAPLPEELAANQPKFFPVDCQVCNSVMQALESQVGKELTCPDCGKKTKVPPPLPEKEAESVLVPDGEEYQLDETVPPPRRSVPKPVAARAVEGHAEFRETLREEYGERCKMPRMPLIQGVLPMLVRRPLPTWWFVLTAVAFSLVALSLVGGAFFVVAVPIIAFVGALGFGAASALFCAILTDSSEGNNRLYNAPSFVPHEWFAEAAYMGLAIAMGLFPGWAIGKLTTQPELSAVIGLFVCFPIVLLSSLEQGSPLGVFSSKMMTSLFRRPGHWLAFYLTSGLMLVVAGAINVALVNSSSLLLGVLIVPVTVAAAIVYFRLLGRFAWWLAESLPAKS